MLSQTHFDDIQDSIVALTNYLVRKDTIRCLEKHDSGTLSTRTSWQTRDQNVLRSRLDNSIPLARCDDLKVCIVGAGIAGLYTAMLLDTVGIQWKIIEANPERLGGRLYTHYFGEDEDTYYDAGAMRYPRVPAMATLDRLVQLTETVTEPYYANSIHNNVPSRYNDTTVFPSKTRKDGGNTVGANMFKARSEDYGTVSQEFLAACEEILPVLRRRINDDIRHAMGHSNPEYLEAIWSSLLKLDRHSVRQTLSTLENHDQRSIDWLDTLCPSTNLLNHGIVYNAFGSLIGPSPSLSDGHGTQEQATTAFPPKEEQQTSPHVPWYRISGGGVKLVNNIVRTLNGSGKQETDESAIRPRSAQRIFQGKRVVKIDHDKNSKTQPIEVWYTDTCPSDSRFECEHEFFDATIVSTTLGALQAMDLRGLDLPYATKAAIRSINYSGATKIAVKFKTPWWAVRIDTRDGKGADFDFKIIGGIAHTDMPIRNCVYPSKVSPNGPAVLLCSYTWAQDSQRLASMISESDPTVNDHIMQVVLSNLARLHTQDDEDYKDLLHYLENDFISYHAYDWSKDKFACGGGFAHYLPGQLESHFAAIVRPLSDARFHIIGEAASAHPGWVLGSLDSAARGVYMLLERFNLKEEQKLLAEKFGDFKEIDERIAHLEVALSILENDTS